MPVSCCAKSAVVARLFLNILLALIAGLSSPAVWGQEIASTYKPVVGQPHPDFALPAIDDGRRVALSDFRGQKVLLFHFASW